MSAQRSTCSRVLAFAGSLRLATTLLLLLIIACIAGGLIPQSPTTPNAETIYQSYGLFAYRVITRLQLDDVFGNPWFISLVSLFSLNLLLCTGRRLRGSLQLAFGQARVPEPPQEPLHRLLLPERPSEHALESAIREALQRAGFARVDRLSSRDQRTWFTGRRRRWGALGADIVHFGVLIILLGALLGILREEGSFRIYEWQVGARIASCVTAASDDCIPLPYDIEIEDFGVETYDQEGRIKDYWADVALWEEGNTARRERISVNRPMSIGGTGLYMWRCGEDIAQATVRLQVVDTARNLATTEIELRVGETALLVESQTRVTAIQYLPSLSPGKMSAFIDSEDPSAETPAILLEIESVDEHGIVVVDRILAWPFLPQEDKDRELGFLLSGVRLPRFIDLHVTRNPGYPFFWWGFLLVMIGLAIAFYLHPATLHVAVAGDRLAVFAKGRDSSRRGERFTREISEIHTVAFQEEDGK